MTADAPPPGWTPTHRVPDGGLAAWAAPDTGERPAAELAAGLPVELVAERDGWASVRCSNGWMGWVDGRRLEAGPGAPAGPATATGFLDRLQQPGGTWLALASAGGVGVVTSLLLWPLLAVPGNILKDAIPRGNCIGKIPGTSSMYVCSAKVGFLTALGPLLALVAAVVFRRPLGDGLARLTSNLPSGSSTLVVPAVATSLFTLVHASVHANTADQSGILPQRMFPAVVGVATLAASRLGPAVAKRFGPALRSRDRIPLPVRAVVALAVPMLFAYVTMNQDRVSETATKEQVVALLTLGTSYAALVPADGDLMGAASRLLTRRGTRA